MAPKIQLFVVLATSFLSHFLVMTSFADEGKATFYTRYIPSACNGYKREDSKMIAAASDAFWNDGEACRKTYSVQCTGPREESGNDNPCTCANQVIVTIVDYCAGCHGAIDFSQEAFASIADPVAGVIRVEYNSF